MALNRNRPYGTISPIWKGASYSQFDLKTKETKYFNQQGLEVDTAAGGKVVEEVEKPKAKDAGAKESRAEAANNLLAQADKIPFNKWALKAAALIGGNNPPSTKSDIRAALDKIVVSESGKKAEEPAAETTNDEADLDQNDADSGIDLVAWASGEADFLFPDVASEIRRKYARDVTSKADAIDVLIDEGIVTEGDVMKPGLAVPDHGVNAVPDEQADEVETEQEPVTAADPVSDVSELEAEAEAFAEADAEEAGAEVDAEAEEADAEAEDEVAEEAPKEAE